MPDQVEITVTEETDEVVIVVQEAQDGEPGPPGPAATVTNATVNSAIADNPSATITSLGLGSAALLAESDLMASAITRTAEQGSPNVPNYSASVVTVTGTLAVSPGKPVPTPYTLEYRTVSNGKPYWRDTLLATEYVAWDGAKWVLAFRITGVVGRWWSTDDTATPDLATFVQQGAATGTPALALSGVTYDAIDAESVGQYCRVGDAAPYDWYIAETAGVGTTTWRQVYDLPTPEEIGAATAAQGAKADTAYQPEDASTTHSANSLIKWSGTEAATRSNLGITATGDTLATAESKAAARAAMDLDAANSVTFANITSTGGTITADAPNTLTQTWNNSGVTFAAQKVNVTDTASNATSLLADWQVGGSSKASVRKDGFVSSATGFFTTGGSGYIVSRDLGTARTDGFYAQASTPASAGSPVKNSPSVTWFSRAWNTTATASSKVNTIEALLIPVSGSTTSGKLTFRNVTVDGTANSNELMTISTDGSVFVNGPVAFKPLASATPSANGDLTFEATSNTSVTVKLKGSDGVVRSVVLTLA